MNHKSHSKRRRTDDPARARYEEAWGGKPDGSDTPPIERRKVHLRFSQRGIGRVVMIAPVIGALGAYLLYRRRR